jgi:hypothetical protein
MLKEVIKACLHLTFFSFLIGPTLIVPISILEYKAYAVSKL